MLCNFLLTTKYSVIDYHIFMTAIPLLQYDIKQHINPAIKVSRTPLTANILLNHQDIEIYLGLFHTNEVPSLHTKSFKITFLTAEISSPRRAEKIIQELDTVANMYTAIGFNTIAYHRYNEFDINDLREHIRPASLNI